MRTYLLERSRLVFQPKNERNYHIFYQLCAAAPAAERAELGLGTWDTFHYLNQGQTGVVQEMDDVQEFAATQKALSIVGVSVSMQWYIQLTKGRIQTLCRLASYRKHKNLRC
jgi:myosin V